MRTTSHSKPNRPDDAHGDSFDAKTPGDWPEGVPANVGTAINKLAARAGGGGAPTNLSYVTAAAEAGLSAERVATAGGGVAITDDGAGPATLTIAARCTIFITDVTTSGGSTVSNKNHEADTSPANKVVTGADSDGNVVVHVEVDAAAGGAVGQGWQPTVTIRGGDSDVAITNLTPIAAGSRRFSGSVAIATATPGDYTINADAIDGGRSQDITLTRTADPPLVLTAVIDNHPTTTGGDPFCPAAQTQCKQGDTLAISGTTESHANEVYVKDYEVTNGQGLQGPFAVTAGVWSGTINCGSGDTAIANYKCYAKVTGGTAGADKISTKDVDLNQTTPTFSGGSQSDITYPATQEALKDIESCSVTVTHTNAAGGDTHLYDDNSTGELTIPSTTTYSATKAGVTRAGGTYRESGTNYRLTATRTTLNGKSATKNVTVKIAHATPTLTVTPTTRFGTDDGTNGYRDRTITLTSSQANLSTHTAAMTADAGDTSAFTGSWSASGDLVYTRTFRVEDGDINAGGQAANNFSWASVSVKNRAGKEATTITTNPDYSIGGFQKRTLTIAAWPNRKADIGCFAVATSNLTAEALSKGGGGPGGGTMQTFDNSPGSGTPDDEVDKFCIADGSDLVDDDGQYYFNKDQANAESNTSGTAQVDIEETA